jgi:hypothetical protein
MPQSDTALIAQLRTEIPFILPAVIPTTGTTRCGHGIIVPVTAAANTSIVVTHGLGRKVQAAIVLANNGGALFPPRLMFGTLTSTPNQVNLIGDTAMTNCLVFLL